MTELAAPGATPSLDEVRDKIERRYANAIGSAELAQNSVQGRMLEVQQSTVQMAGHSRLEEIRASMRGGPAGEVTGGEQQQLTAQPQVPQDQVPQGQVPQGQVPQGQQQPGQV
jgi:phage shock protein A